MIAASIIMPAYNSESYIANSIESVLNQTLNSWELIIIDDCSTDNTLSIIKSFHDTRIKLIKTNKNSGAAESRNKGIKAANGRYIAFLDSDDLWHKEKLEKQINFMQAHNHLITYTNYNQIDNDGNYIKSINCPKSLTYNNLLKKNYIGCLTAIYDSHQLGKVYMPAIRKRQDYALWLKILKNNTIAFCLDEILASYRVHSNSISSNKLSAAKYNWILYRDIEKINLIKSIYYFLNYAINGLISKIKN